jgi:hypothetical protein
VQLLAVLVMTIPAWSLALLAALVLLVTTLASMAPRERHVGTVADKHAAMCRAHPWLASCKRVPR